MKLVMGLLAALATTNVAAQQAIYAFTTEIERITVFGDTSNTFSDVQNYSPGGLAIGQTLYGGFTYNTDWKLIPDADPSGSPYASVFFRTDQYVWIGNDTGFFYQNGSALNTDNQAAVSPGSPLSGLPFRTDLSFFAVEETPTTTYHVIATFFNQSGGTITGLKLPSVINLDNIDGGKMGFFRTNTITGNQLGVYTNITSLNVIPVPEMPIWALMLCGLFLTRLTIFRRRCKINV
ncbi:MAG: hypothetical protein EOO68_03600 [Moraxellaceae bacterium]|nr:MAG: hypothetical protein EOO68_03600 [Moraxellaceae bacterium]